MSFWFIYVVYFLIVLNTAYIVIDITQASVFIMIIIMTLTIVIKMIILPLFLLLF